MYKGIHKESSEAVAIKMVPVEGDLEDLAKEIRILRRCESNYITRYYGSYNLDGSLWIVMEYCGGGAVDDPMEITENTLSEAVIQHIVSASLLGLAYLHANKNIHRDIKAGNILLTESGGEAGRLWGFRSTGIDNEQTEHSHWDTTGWPLSEGEGHSAKC